MADSPNYPQTETQLRELKKRQKPGGGKAGRINQKGGAPTSNKARGGKRAR